MYGLVYEYENIVADDIDQQMTQSNNVTSSFQSHNREMQVQREEIFFVELKFDETVIRANK